MEALAAPKVDNLYRQKSKLLTERMTRAQKIDNWGLLPVTALIAVLVAVKIHWGMSVYLTVILTALFLYNRRCIRRTEELKIGDDVYHYLVGYRERMRINQRRISRILTIGVPLVILPVYYYMFFIQTDKAVQAIESQGLGLFVLLVVGIGLLLSLMGYGAYWIGTRVVYGRIIRRMDQMIMDMEELSA